MTSLAYPGGKAGALAVERARDMLQKCKGVDEAKEIRDQAAAVAVYLRQRGAAEEAASDAAEIVILAERRVGSFLVQIVKNPGGRPAKETGTGSEPVKPPTLADMGLTKNLAARAQRLAELPDDVFHEKLADARERGKLTVAAVLGKAKSPREQTMRTPAWLFAELERVFGRFSLDAYASPHNALCDRFYTAEEDSNAQPWIDQTFANPEFDDMWTPTAKAVAEAEERDVVTVMLAPVGCAQEWYHVWAIRGTIYVPDMRINYDEPDGTPTKGADRDSIAIAFGGKYTNPHWKQGQFRVHRITLRGAYENANHR